MLQSIVPGNLPELRRVLLMPLINVASVFNKHPRPAYGVLYHYTRLLDELDRVWDRLTGDLKTLGYGGDSDWPGVKLVLEFLWALVWKRRDVEVLLRLRYCDREPSISEVGAGRKASSRAGLVCFLSRATAVESIV